VNPPDPSGASLAQLNAVTCTTGANCWAVGYYSDSTGLFTLTDRWNGTNWEAMKSPNPSGSSRSQLQSVYCTSSSNCWAVGNYMNSSDSSVTLAERWNGTKWYLVSTPNG
jgi:hypothetical protein